ncbi:hypothetical protein N2152v2_004593 [Parachlorella kessleri]
MSLTEGNCFCEVLEEPLDILQYTKLVSDPGAGAIASFTGVTRDTFQGKAVEKLEYEAYVPMALKKLLEICRTACDRWNLKKVAVAHRTGTVHIGEASVIIVASSPHRRDALEACHWAIDELKATVPIWKKEFFEGGEVWKENEESRRSLAAGAP